MLGALIKIQTDSVREDSLRNVKLINRHGSKVATVSSTNSLHDF